MPSHEEGQRAGRYDVSCAGTQRDPRQSGDKETGSKLGISSYP